jgi:hypothetical protein
MTESKRTAKAAAILGVLLASACPAEAQESSAGIYRDPLNGFTLRPPTGGERMAQDEDATYLARWVNHDKEGDVCWTLTVSRMILHQVGPTLEEYGRTLRDAMLTQGLRGSTVDEPRTTAVSGLPAIELNGVLKISAKIGMADVQAKEEDIHFRQLWVRVRPAEKILPPPTAPNQPTHKPAAFLVFKMGAPQAKGGVMDGEWKAMLRSLTVEDPEEFLVRLKKDTGQAASFLGARLAQEAIAAAMPAAARWFRLQQGRGNLGWLRVQGGAARVDGNSGYEIRTWAMIQHPGQPVRLVRQRMFLSEDTSMEIWRLHRQVGSGPQAPLMVEDGIRQKNLIFVDLHEQNQIRSLQRDVPEAVKAYYLPKAVGLILPSLLDLNRKTTYVFAEYNSAIHGFDMRTVQVFAPEMISLGGRPVEAVRLVDQPAFDADPITLWVDARGDLLRAKASDGMTTEFVTEQEILRAFPKANSVVREMDAAEEQSRAYKKSRP